MLHHFTIIVVILRPVIISEITVASKHYNVSFDVVHIVIFKSPVLSKVTYSDD